jgi:hypothetical protein
MHVVPRGYYKVLIAAVESQNNSNWNLNLKILNWNLNLHIGRIPVYKKLSAFEQK